MLEVKWESSKRDKQSGLALVHHSKFWGLARHQKAPSQDTGRKDKSSPCISGSIKNPGPLPSGPLTWACADPPTQLLGSLSPCDPRPQVPHPALRPLQGPTCSGDTNTLSNLQSRPFHHTGSQFPLLATMTRHHRGLWKDELTQKRREKMVAAATITSRRAPYGSQGPVSGL